MKRCVHLCRLTHLAAASLYVTAACLVAGLSVICPTAGHAQGDPVWSTPVRFYDGARNSHESVLVSDPFGAAHLVWAGSDEQIFYYSRWNGVEWTPPIDVIVALGDAERLGVPELVAATDGKLHLFWAADGVMHSWAWADSANSAPAWSTPEAVVFSEGLAGGTMGARQDRFGAFHLVYSQGGDIYYVRSDNEGLTWSEPVKVNQVGLGVKTGAPKLDIDADGAVHVVWNEWPIDSDPAQANRVFYVHSVDGGASWSAPRQMGGLADSGGNVLAGPDGVVYLAWQAGINSASKGRFLQRSTDGGETWDAPISFSQVSAQSGVPGLALDSDGTLHVITGDGEYVSWDGQTISPPLDLRPLPEQTENSRLAVVGGNQVLAVVMPFFSPGIYYAVRQLPLPAWPTAEPPARAPARPMSAPEATAEPTSTSAAMANVVAENANAVSRDQSTPSTISALLFGAGFSLALVAAVVIAQVSRRRG